MSMMEGHKIEGRAPDDEKILRVRKQYPVGLPLP